MVNRQSSKVTGHSSERTVEERMQSVSSDASSEEENVPDAEGMDRVMDRIILKLKKENRDLKRKNEVLQDEVEGLKEEADNVRKEVIRQSQKNFSMNQDLFKQITDFTKKKLFRHIKFITSDDILDDLEKKKSLANITMNHFNVDTGDRISWWRACRISVSDTIGNQRNQVAQAIKTQVLSEFKKVRV
jgi:uncharacterized membrane-anchored protein YhcB (DUF1043 family)